MTRLAPNDQLRVVRESKQLSRELLAEQLGTSRQNIGRWERGDALPDLQFIHKLCAIFGMSAEELGFPPTVLQSAPDSKQAIYDPAIPLAPAIPLVGREQKIASLKHDLKVGGNAVLTALNGLPGVGKTALAIALAHDKELREYFYDGILWAGLGPEPNIQGQLRRWGKLLGLSNNEMDKLKSSEAWAIALRMAIDTKHMLLVIDDAWQIEESLTFKVGGPNCAHLVTTRFPAMAMHMNADNMTVIQELSEKESMTLLRILAPQIVERETKKAHALVQAVGGLPLALTLMGNYLRLQTYSGQSRRIHAALEQLSNAEARLQLDEPRAPSDRHPSLPVGSSLSLQSIIAVTDQQLREQTSSALYALSVFPSKPNNFSEEAALTVAACSGDMLDELTDAGLLESSGESRYMLHQTITDYARLHLEGTAAIERLIEYANKYVENHKTDYELLDQESGIIIAALDAAYTHKKQSELIRGVCTFAPFLLIRGHYTQAERYVQRAHDAAQAQGDRHSITSVLMYKGEIAFRQGNYSQAETSFKEGLSLAHQIGDPEHTSALLKDLGWMTWKQGNYGQAETYLLEGLAIARKNGYQEHICELLSVLGSLTSSRGNYQQAAAYMEEGLHIARQIGNREQICGLLLNLGVTIAQQGHDDQAGAYLKEALDLARQIGHSEWTIVLQLNLGEMAVDQTQYDQAEIYYSDALALARQIGNREWISILLINMGKLAREQGNYTRASACLLESLHLAQQIGRPQIICFCFYEHGNLYLRQEQIETAEAAFLEMLNAIPQGDQELLALAQYGLARVASAKGNNLEAQRLGQESVAVLETMGHRSVQEVRQWLDSIKVA